MKKIIVLIAFISFWGCKKEIIDNGSFILSNSKVVSSDRSIRDDIMIFPDMNSLKRYYNSIEEIIKYNPDTLETLLVSIENNNYHKSLRLKIDRLPITDEMVKNNITYKEDFVADDIVASILNENFEMKVGEDYYVYMSKNIILKTKCEESRRFLLNIEKGKTTEYYLENIIDENIKLVGDKIIANYEKVTIVDTTSIFIDECSSYPVGILEPEGIFYDVIYTTIENRQDDGCEDWKVVELGVKVEQITFHPSGNPTRIPWPADITIDNGNGEVVSFSNSTGEVEAFEYEEGIYHPVITVKYTNHFGATVVNTNDHLDFEVTEFSICGEIKTTSKEEWSYGTTRAMLAELWIDKDFWSGAEVLKAKTTGYKKKKNGNWKKTRGTILASMTANYANESCVSIGSESETSKCKNCKSRQAERIANSSLLMTTEEGHGSSHKFSDNTENFSTNLVLKGCE